MIEASQFKFLPLPSWTKYISRKNSFSLCNTKTARLERCSVRGRAYYIIRKWHAQVPNTRHSSVRVSIALLPTYLTPSAFLPGLFDLLLDGDKRVDLRRLFKPMYDWWNPKDTCSTIELGKIQHFQTNPTLFSRKCLFLIREKLRQPCDKKLNQRQLLEQGWSMQCFYDAI